MKFFPCFTINIILLLPVERYDFVFDQGKGPSLMANDHNIVRMNLNNQ